MRPVQTAGARREEAVRMAAGRAPGGGAAGVGARARRSRRVSEVAGDGAQCGMAGEIPRVEVRGRRGTGRVGGAGGGRNPDAREAMAGGGEWPAETDLRQIG